MTTTTERAITCPDWCIEHNDVNRPDWSNADLRRHDEVAEGHFVHLSADKTVGKVDVSIAICADWDGRECHEPPTVFVDGHDLTPAQAHDLARYLHELANAALAAAEAKDAL